MHITSNNFIQFLDSFCIKFYYTQMPRKINLIQKVICFCIKFQNSFLSHPVFSPPSFVYVRVRRLEQDPPRYYRIAILWLRHTFWVSLLMGIPIPHTLVTTSKISVGFLSQIDASLYTTGRDSRLQSVILHQRCQFKKGGIWHRRKKKRSAETGRWIFRTSHYWQAGFEPVRKEKMVLIVYERYLHEHKMT